MTQTAPQLFANYLPSAADTERCFYCGGFCGREHRAVDIVKSSFTALDTTTGKAYVCPGCIEAMNETADVQLLCGEVRTSQKTRLYSWLVFGRQRWAATKAHRVQLTSWCTNPPPAPFVISLSDSGQRQLLYRAVVCYSREQITVTLEGLRIDYRPDQLIDRLQLMKQIAAATGKPALLETITPNTAMRVVEYFGDEEPLTRWIDAQNEALTKLAAWLCPPKEECQSEYPERPIESPVIAAAAAASRYVKPGGSQATFGWTD